MATLYYFHDPMCSWCWGYRPTARKLFSRLPAGVKHMNVVGGLAPDSDEPMPVEQQKAVAGYWRRIESMLGTRFNHDFWTHCEPRRSTYPACRAVIAASRQGCEEEMTYAIQKAYYLQARNPSDISTLEELASELGLDEDNFASDIRSADVETEFQRQIAFTRRAQVSGFPSLALDVGGAMNALTLDYKNFETTLSEITQLLP